MTRADFFALPVLSSQFPLAYGNGAKWTGMTGECGSCEKPFEDSCFRGTAEPGLQYADGTSRVYMLDGVGLCEGCERVTHFRYRLYDDMSMVGMKDGECARWVPRRSWWSRLRKFLRGL